MKEVKARAGRIQNIFSGFLSMSALAPILFSKKGADNNSKSGGLNRHTNVENPNEQYESHGLTVDTNIGPTDTELSEISAWVECEEGKQGEGGANTGQDENKLPPIFNAKEGDNSPNKFHSNSGYTSKHPNKYPAVSSPIKKRDTQKDIPAVVIVTSHSTTYPRASTAPETALTRGTIKKKEMQDDHGVEPHPPRKKRKFTGFNPM